MMSEQDARLVSLLIFGAVPFLVALLLAFWFDPIGRKDAADKRRAAEIEAEARAERERAAARRDPRQASLLTDKRL